MTTTPATTPAADLVRRARGPGFGRVSVLIAQVYDVGRILEVRPGERSVADPSEPHP